MKKNAIILTILWLSIFSPIAANNQNNVQKLSGNLKTKSSVAVAIRPVDTPKEKISLPGDAIIFNENFDSTATKGDWYQEIIDSTYLNIPKWSLTSASYQGDSGLYLNSSYTAFSSARLIFDSLNFTESSFIYLDIFMYHNGYSISSVSNERIQIQISSDGEQWTNVGDPIYEGGYTNGWKNHQIDLTSFAGQSNLYLGIVGYGTGNYSDIYIDSLVIKSAEPGEMLPVAGSGSYSSVTGVSATFTGTAFANATSAEVIFKYLLSGSTEDSITTDPITISGYFEQDIETEIKDLEPSSLYYAKMIVSNAVGDSVDTEFSFYTNSIGEPVIYNTSVLGNDANEIAIEISAYGNETYTTATMNYGLDSNLTNTVSGNIDEFTGSEVFDFVFNNLLLDTSYYYQVILSNSEGYDSSAILNIKTPKEDYYDTLMSGEAFLKGKYINVGLSSGGYFGSSNNGTDDMHGRPYAYGGYGNVGFVADPDKDGWYSGIPGYLGDYFMPGSPEEGWDIQVANTNYYNNGSSGSIISGSITHTADSAGYLIADWQGTQSGLDIEQRVKLPIDSLYFTFEVTITNTNDATVKDIYYMRNVDPDNEAALFGSEDVGYYTINSIVNQNPNNDNIVLVSAEGLNFGSYLAFCANDKRARVTHGGFSNRNAQDIWEGNGVYTEGSIFADAAISIAFKIDSLEPGECTTLIYAYILSEDQVPSALKATMLNLGVEGEAGIDDNVYVCEGENATLTVNNGEDYEWIWTDNNGDTLSTSNALELSNVTEEATYEAIGSFHCYDTTLSITVMPSAIPVGTITNNDQTINSGGTLAAITLGTSNEVTGTTFAWTRTNPSGLETTLADSGTITSGESFAGTVLTNTSADQIEVILTFIPTGPTASQCTGEAITASIKINPASSAIIETNSLNAVLSPNPNNGIFNINFNSSEESVDLYIINTAGQIVYTKQKVDNGSTINLGNLNSGLYIVTLKSAQKTQQIKMSIK